MSSSERFWDRIAERYSRRPVADEASYRKKLAMTQDHLRPDMAVLEFGCGTGSTAIEHALHVESIRAIDISSKMIGIARAKAEAAEIENVTFERNTIETLEVPDASFDVALGLSILHLLADRDAVVAKVHRIVKPGGLFVTSTPCLGDMARWLRPIAPLGALLGLIPSVAFFTADDLVAEMTRAGFAIENRWQPARDKALFLVARKMV